MNDNKRPDRPQTGTQSASGASENAQPSAKDTVSDDTLGEKAKADAQADTSQAAGKADTKATTKADLGENGDKKKEEGSVFAFAIKLALLVVLLRTFVFSFFAIPSESMMPTLVNGDYLIAAKWPYGYSRYSVPFSLPLIPGRIFASEPERGDIVIFKHPIDKTDYIKRVVGLPGDTVEMSDGQLVLNGTPVKTESVADFTIDVSPNTSCNNWGAQVKRGADGHQICVYKRQRESLPGGKTHMQLDFGDKPIDNFAPIIVPEGQMFVMGDNRDNSMDSRFPAMAGQGVGLVPQELLVGRAGVIAWSTDGSANWFLPWTWFTAARWERIGNTL